MKVSCEMSGKKVDTDRIEKAVNEILIAVGEDPSREGLKHTPERVARMYVELLVGIREDPKTHTFAEFSMKTMTKLFYFVTSHFIVSANII